GCMRPGWRSSTATAGGSGPRSCAVRPTKKATRHTNTLDLYRLGVTLRWTRSRANRFQSRNICAAGAKCSRPPAVRTVDRPSGGFMHRRFTVLAALLTGALAAVAALPLVSACEKRAQTTLFAADAQAAAAAPSTAETVRQTGAMPSLAPLVKQLRPVVVNINSRFKPRGPKVAQRGL